MMGGEWGLQSCSPPLCVGGGDGCGCYIDVFLCVFASDQSTSDANGALKQNKQSSCHMSLFFSTDVCFRRRWRYSSGCAEL